MYVNKDKRTLYFRVPGTGSTSFMNVAGQFHRVGLDHEMLFDISEEQKEKYKDWQVITIIRNPYDWAKTFHAMCTRAEKHWEEWCKGKWHKEILLENFIEVLAYTPLDWISRHGEVVGKVYKIEEPEILKSDFDIKGDIGRLNCHGKSNWGKWTPKAIEMAKEKLHRELAYYE